MTDRPICSTHGCDNTCQIIRTNKKTGKINWRKVCSHCHSRRTAAKHGLRNITEVVAKNAGFDSVPKYLDHRAQTKGFNGITEQRNSTHPSRKFRKDYCENRDGRLGFKCTYPMDLPSINGKKFLGHLDVDHIDGNPEHNTAENFQTLCSCCHDYKTIMNGDGATPGRKTLKAKQ